MCSVLKLFSLEVDPPFLAFRTELHATTHTAVELEAALVPCYAAAVTIEVVIFKCYDADGVPVVLEAVNDVVTWVGARLVLGRLVVGRPVLGRPVRGGLVLGGLGVARLGVARLGVARLADNVRHLEDGRTNRRPAASRETCQKRACSAHTLRPPDQE